MKTVSIKREDLEKATREAISEMINFPWSGWKIDILVDKNNEIYCSNKNTSNCYLNSVKLFSVESAKYGADEWACEEDFIYELTLWYIENFKEVLITNDIEIILTE